MTAAMRRAALPSEAVLNSGPCDGEAWTLHGAVAPAKVRVPRLPMPSLMHPDVPLGAVVYRLVGFDGPRALYLYDHTEGE